MPTEKLIIIICYVSQVVLHAHVMVASNKVHNRASVDSTEAEIVDRFIKMNCGENDDVIDDNQTY